MPKSLSLPLRRWPCWPGPYSRRLTGLLGRPKTFSPMRRSSLYLALVRFVTGILQFASLTSARNRTAGPSRPTRSPLHRACGINCEGAHLGERSFEVKFSGGGMPSPSLAFRSGPVPRRIDQCPNDSTNGFDFARRPACLGEDGAKCVLGRLRARGRVEITLGLEFAVQLADEALDLAVRRDRLELLCRWLREIASPRPFIREEDHRLGQVERTERGIDRNGHDRVRERHVLGFEPRALWSKEDGAPLFGRSNLIGHLPGTEDRHNEVPPPDGRGENLAAVRDRLGNRVEDLGALEHDIRPARGGAGIGVGPAVARSNEAHLDEIEVQHRPSRLPDILSELGADEDHDGLVP